MNKCSEYCINFNIPWNDSDLVKCTGPCNRDLHDICANLPRNYKNSGSLAKYLKECFICTDCRSFSFRFEKQFEEMQKGVQESLVKITSTITNLDKKIDTNHSSLSDAFDDLSKDVDLLKKDLMKKLNDSMKKPDESISSNTVATNSDFESLKALIDSEFRSVKEDIKLLTEKVNCNLDSSFDTFRYNQTLINENAEDALSGSLHTELLTSSATFDLTRNTSPNVEKSPKRNSSSQSISVSKNKKEKNAEYDLIETDAGFQLAIGKKNKNKKVKFVENLNNDRKNPRQDKMESKDKKRINREKNKYELIYVTRTPNYMNEGELSRYLVNELRIKEHSCHLVVPYNKRRCDLNYLNFKIRVLSTDVDTLMNSDSWPFGVVVKRWKTGADRQRTGKMSEFRPNFYHH